MTIFKLELANDFPPLVKIVTDRAIAARLQHYYTLGDLETLDLEDAFKGSNHRPRNLVHGGRVRKKSCQTGDGKTLEPTGDNTIPIGHIGGYIQGESVAGDAVSIHLDTDGSDLRTIDPYTGKVLDRIGVHTKFI